jgi:FimV-like protein
MIDLSIYSQIFLNIQEFVSENMDVVLIFLISASVVLLFFSIYQRKKTSKNQAKKSNYTITSQDIKAIAGDNVLTTQLDLARAYIEMGKKSLAKKILEHVSKNGDSSQKYEAKELLAKL